MAPRTTVPPAKALTAPSGHGTQKVRRPHPTALLYIAPTPSLAQARHRAKRKAYIEQVHDRVTPDVSVLLMPRMTA